MDNHAEESDSIATVHDFCLLRVDGEFQFFFQISACLLQGVFRSALRPGENQDIVRIANDPVTTAFEEIGNGFIFCS
jgi:hypothetical protein